MELRPGCCLVLLMIFLLFCDGRCFSNISVDYLDSIVREYALRVLVHRRTGVVYNVPLPAYLAGVEASIIRVRSRSLWSKGAEVGTARIPPRTLPVPSARRLVVVFQNLGNWSFLFDHHAPGHELVAPVVGLLVYDASNVSSNGVAELGLSVAGDPISISFPELVLPAARCARFGQRGAVHIDAIASPSSCLTTRTGHFAVVVPQDASIVRPKVVVAQAKKSKWMGWVIVFGVLVLALVGGGVGVGFCKLRNKRERMEQKADEGEVLSITWVEGSKMPSARMIRTQPAIETGTAP